MISWNGSQPISGAFFGCRVFFVVFTSHFFSYITFSCVILNSSSALFLPWEIHVGFLSLQKYFPSLPRWYGKRRSVTLPHSSTDCPCSLPLPLQPAGVTWGKKFWCNHHWNKTRLPRRFIPCPPLPQCFLSELTSAVYQNKLFMGACIYKTRYNICITIYDPIPSIGTSDILLPNNPQQKYFSFFFFLSLSFPLNQKTHLMW